MKTTLIENYHGRKIVKLENEGQVEWVVCRDYDETALEEPKLSNGIYFDSLIDAAFYAGQLNRVYLLVIGDDEESSSRSRGFVVRSREAAYCKIREFMQKHEMNEPLDWDELKKCDYTPYGKWGYIKIENYHFGEELELS